MRTIDTRSISDYAKDENESIDDEFAEFSPKFQAYKTFRTCLTLTSTNQYQLARKVFYDNLSWFSVMFDSTFTMRCDAINRKYASEEYRQRYSAEQLEQLKYIRVVTEFTRLLIDVSSKRKIKINTDPSRRVEMVPVGYSQVLFYDRMVGDFFTKLNQVQRQKNHREVVKFFHHSLSWFGGIFDAKFLMQGYLIAKTIEQREVKYRRLLIAFSKLLTRKSITPAPFIKLVYKPRPSDQVPRSVEDVVKSRYHKKEDEVTPEQDIPQDTGDVTWKDILDF